ncbi:MAG: PAS domain S-box protein [Halanaeroarchaeum sp.]
MANQAGAVDERPDAFGLLSAVATTVADERTGSDLWASATGAAVDAGFDGAAALVDGVLVSTAGDHWDGVTDVPTPSGVEGHTVDGRTSWLVPVRDEAVFVVRAAERSLDDDRLAKVGEYLDERLTAIEAAGEEDEIPARRRTFRKLHSVAAQMVGLESEAGVFHLAIDAAENVLEFDSCSIDVVENGTVVPTATSRSVPEPGAQPVPVDDSLAGRRYRENRSIVVEDATGESGVSPVADHYHSVLTVPIEDVGVFQAVAAEPGAFGERESDLAELLFAHVSQTITRIRSDEKLRENEAKYRTLVEQSHDAVLIVQDRTVAYANERAADLFGRERPSLVSVDVLELLHDEDREYVVETGAVAIQDEGATTVDARVVRPDGSVRHCEFSLTPISYRGGDAVMTTVRDITERIAYERELERQNERLEEFASVLSHDLRNPLTVASGRVLLAQETDEDEHLAIARTALDRMQALIDDVLALARQGRQVTETESVSVADVAAAAWETVDTPEATISIDVEELTVAADRRRLRRLLENLFRNAVDHAGPSVAVTVSALEDGFAVADDGPGIPADRRERVFDRGFTDDPEGTGFGLAIVQNIADAHGWSVEAVPGGSGARFEVRDVRVE